MYQFEWDSGNVSKLVEVRESGRNFTISEIESVFIDPKRLVLATYPDPISQENRYITIGTSNRNQVISVVFVIRVGVIRVFNVWKPKGQNSGNTMSKIKQVPEEFKQQYVVLQTMSQTEISELERGTDGQTPVDLDKLIAESKAKSVVAQPAGAKATT